MLARRASGVQAASGGMSLVTNSTSATYSFSTGGASAVTWYAYQGETLLDTASGDSPSFDLSGATANVTITTDPETPSLSDLDCTGDTTLIEVNGVDLSSASGAVEDWDGCTSMTSFNATAIGSGSFYRAWRDCSSLTSFPALDLSGGTSFQGSWNGCNSMTSFNASDIGAGSFSRTWEGCSSLTSFPALDLSGGTTFEGSWSGCSSMTSFNASAVGSGSFLDAWQGCSSLPSFPALDLSGGTSFEYAWDACSSMTSFNASAVGSGSFYRAWRNCSSLTSFPALDLSGGTRFTNAWVGCLLDQQSTENVLVALDNGGASSLNTIIGTDGTSLSTAAAAAKTSLEGKGWTITIEDNS